MYVRCDASFGVHQQLYSNTVFAKNAAENVVGFAIDNRIPNFVSTCSYSESSRSKPST